MTIIFEFKKNFKKIFFNAKMSKYQEKKKIVLLHLILKSNAPPLVLFRFIEKCYQSRGLYPVRFFCSTSRGRGPARGGGGLSFSLKNWRLWELGESNCITQIIALTVTHAAPNPVLFYAAISNFLVLRVRAE